VRALRRLLICLLLGVLCGVGGGYAALRIAGSSVQRTAAGDARVTILPSSDPQLLVHVHDPRAELRFRPWGTPVAVTVDLLRTDDVLLARAAFADAGARDTLVAAARRALQDALIRTALVALAGALAAGLLGGLVVALVTRGAARVLATGIWAVVVCAALLAIAGLQTRNTIDQQALSRPSCPVVPRVSLASVVGRLLSGTRPSPTTIRALALRAACSPAFARQLRRSGAQRRAILGR
jgi:ABC-type uncharacterized transport system permease subunit